MVDLIQGTPRLTKLFAKCLTALPNLHSLEIVSAWDHKLAEVLVTALGKEKPQLQRVRTLVLPPQAYGLLRYCPNVEDLTCCRSPDEHFIETLVESRSNHLTKFSAVYVRELGDTWSSAAYFVSRSPLMR